VVAELADALLSELGYDPRVVHSANEALARLSCESDFDLVFTDVIMPGGLSGLELATKVRERYPEMPILLTTGYSDKLGGDLSQFPLLPKPYDFEALDSALALLAPVRAKTHR
jgi:CheY-like chemotaxis protein